MQAEQLLSQSVQHTGSIDLSKTAIVTNKLVHLNEQSETGFDAAAHHVRNRGMKLWLKSQAAQRRAFAEELHRFQSAEKFEDKSLPVQSFFARLHRGWIDARATMVIGRKDTERLVLAQVRRVENSVVLRSYNSALSADIPQELEEILLTQVEKIEKTNEQLSLMLGDGDEQLVIQLFDTECAMQNAVSDLDKLSSVSHKSTAVSLDDMMTYDSSDDNARIREIASASMLLGLVPGAVFGYLAGSVASINAAAPSPILALVFIGGVFGLLCGLLFGLIGGSSNVVEDKHAYADALTSGNHLLFTQTRKEQVLKTRHVLRQNRWQKAVTTSSIA